MPEQSKYPRPARLDDQPRNRRLSIVVFALIAVALLAILGVYESIPVAERRANPPPANETAKAVHDLQTSQQRAADQLKALQQTVNTPLQVPSGLPNHFSRQNPRSRSAAPDKPPVAVWPRKVVAESEKSPPIPLDDCLAGG